MNDHDSVVISGAGLVTALGTTLAESWPRFRAGDSGIASCTAFDVSAYSCRAAAQAPGYRLEGLRLPKNQKFMTQTVVHLLRAAQEAVAFANLDTQAIDADRFAAYAGSGQVGPEPSEFFNAFRVAHDENGQPDWEKLGGSAARLIDPYFPLRTLSNAGVALLAMEYGCRGPSNNFVQSDVSSALALDAACRDLLEGRADVALVGAFDCLMTPAIYLAYEKEGLLSRHPPEKAQRPFDAHADGLVLSEGAAVFVLERAKSARSRGVDPLVEVVRVGSASDVAESMEPFRSPETMRKSVTEALGNDHASFVIGTGFSLPAADQREAAALTSLFDSTTLITALKGQTGYAGAATALIEAALAVQMIRERSVLPVAHHSETIRQIAGRLVLGDAAALPANGPVSALCLSHTWAGQAAAIYLRSVS